MSAVISKNRAGNPIAVENASEVRSDLFSNAREIGALTLKGAFHDYQQKRIPEP
jgi:hypothetical protein